MDLRLQYYLGNCCQATFLANVQDGHWIFSVQSIKGPKTYVQDMKCYLENIKETLCLHWYPYDRVEPFDIPTLVKSRPIHDYGQSILLNLNRERHFGDVEKVKNVDCLFSEKKPILIWRGAPTGYGFGNNIPFRQANRELLMKTWSTRKSSVVNVGLVRPSSSQPIGKIPFPFSPDMTMQQLLEYKYILVVEGNDVATSLPWIMASQSIVFMPLPTIASWFMQDRLIPYYHYIPVASDFRDLEDQVHWCENHIDHCHSIIQHANEYVQQFMDPEKELYLARKIVEIYRQNVRFEFKK